MTSQAACSHGGESQRLKLKGHTQDAEVIQAMIRSRDRGDGVLRLLFREVCVSVRRQTRQIGMSEMAMSYQNGLGCKSPLSSTLAVNRALLPERSVKAAGVAPRL